MSRAFLYLVVEKWRPNKWTSMNPSPAVYMVHRINPWRLFFSNKDDDQGGLQAAEAAAVRARLPRPTMALYSPIRNQTMDFALFGRTKDKIVGMDNQGSPVLYDDARRAVSPLPSMKRFKYQPVSLAVGNDLFVMTNPPSADDDDAWSPSAEVLVDPTYDVPDKVWHPIPPPPYLKPGYDSDGTVWSYTVVDESNVWISAKTHGTYSYDMKTNLWRPDISIGEWSKVGDWEMPFFGQAVYAKELDLWFGVSMTDDLETILRAADLRPGADQPPVVAHEWETFKVLRGHCEMPDYTFLVHLGADGRFCIAKFTSNSRHSNSVLITGVEVMRCGDDKADLRLIKHKTYHYGGLDKDRPVCLL